MTIAISRANGDMLWFDSIQSFGRQFSGAVTKHPLETGAVITDHTTIENEVITISGILSDADFNLNRPIIGTQDASLFGIKNKQFVNNTPITRSDVGNELYNNIIIIDRPSLTRFLPESVGQYFQTGSPQVSLNPRTPLSKVKPAVVVQEDLIAMFNNREQFTLVEFSSIGLGFGSSIRKVYDNCVFVGLSFNEDADSGDAVYPVMTIERVRYAVSATTKLQKKTSPTIEKQMSQNQNQGAQSTAKIEDSRDLSPNTRVSYTKDSSGGWLVGGQQ